MSDIRAHTMPSPPPRRRSGGSGSRAWLWILSGLSIVALVTLLILFVFRMTTVTVVPQSQPITFDSSAQFSAYPAASAASGTISYIIQSNDLEDSDAVASTGTQQVETKANGEITVVNAYSSAPIKLIKNTRFQTANGLIFRAPADISIPGKKGSMPGTVTVTVLADAVGSQYNVGPQQRFTLPGLKSAGEEYSQVYANSSVAMTGGFSGDQPGIAPSDLDTARSAIRARLQEKMKAFIDAQNTKEGMVLGAHLSFVDQPNTAETGGRVRVHESAHVDVVIVPSDVFASAITQAVSADASVGSVKLVRSSNFTTTIQTPPSSWGSGPISFSLGGGGSLVSIVDTKALAQALAGRDQSAFQTIVSNFPGLQSAHARIEPFWESRFPSDPGSIHVNVQDPISPQ